MTIKNIMERLFKKKNEENKKRDVIFGAHKKYWGLVCAKCYSILKNIVIHDLKILSLSVVDNAFL